MFRTRADYDNIVVTSNPAITLLADDFDSATNDFRQNIGWPLTVDWIRTAEGVFANTFIDGGARMVNESNARDLTLEAKARAVRFGPGTDRWFGLVVRYIDERNFVYVTVRNTNVISLRKLVNGAITILDTAPMTVTTGTWYTLRLEAIGRSLRSPRERRAHGGRSGYRSCIRSRQIGSRDLQDRSGLRRRSGEKSLKARIGPRGNETEAATDLCRRGQRRALIKEWWPGTESNGAPSLHTETKFLTPPSAVTQK